MVKKMDIHFLSSISVCCMQFLLDFLVMVIQLDSDEANFLISHQKTQEIILEVIQLIGFKNIHFKNLPDQPCSEVGGSLRGVVANVLDYDILVKEFENQSRYYIQFWANTHGKDMIPFIL